MVLCELIAFFHISESAFATKRVSLNPRTPSPLPYGNYKLRPPSFCRETYMFKLWVGPYDVGAITRIEDACGLFH
ncbi:uncharacterized protein F4817DRAFT_330646 [Daldinia loculata]|uniref:uncharacterized protein n=1 Tax=Daldinia loculata TaxID=103429 RepID=UPI0020C4FCEC|nr:uncharacterized protein F4817DRAFT_330646 [Daldinia loculata]KAI1649530.1 hypothetical protein F4817DRAFT_330646 [Daldinia loculata]